MEFGLFRCRIKYLGGGLGQEMETLVTVIGGSTRSGPGPSVRTVDGGTGGIRLLSGSGQ